MLDFSLKPKGFQKPVKCHVAVSERPAENGQVQKAPPVLYARVRLASGKRTDGKNKGYLTKDEVKAVMARRDKIVALLQKLIVEKGESEVLY